MIFFRQILGPLVMMLILNSMLITCPAGADLKTKTLVNPAPYLPPQCYTKTVGANGRLHNTCYTCHTRGMRPDFINDRDLQSEYAFPGDTVRNHWTNHFKDRSAQTAAISDKTIQAYVRSSNYLGPDGTITLATRLEHLPTVWDHDGDGRWSGFIPDCYFNFDEFGFDRSPAGGDTGWRALAYYPFPSTYWPTNGAFSDVVIRLPEAFREVDGRPDRRAYRINLAIVEALIKRRDVIIEPTDENLWGVDLNRNGKLDTARKIVFDWAPVEGRHMAYVGDARRRQQAGTVHLAAGLYPEGTEFLSTLRYIIVDPDGRTRMAPRMKEVRHMQKTRWRTYAELETLAMNEIKERNDFPDRLKLPRGNLEDGISNGQGWVLRGFIEDRDGHLRPQTFEETASCIGCHGGIGATTDSTFALARKLDAGAFQEGWFHWTQKDLRGVNEPKVVFEKAGVQYEYAFYLMYSLAGDEFRANAELLRQFFDAKGLLKPDMANRLHDDIGLLLYPSPERALMLNKIYRAIVAEQSFHLGRDPIIGKADNLHQEIQPADTLTRIKTPVVLAQLTKDVYLDSGQQPPASLDNQELRASVSGSSMVGPNGQRYQINAHGLIDESRYALTQEGFYFPFPPRHTLPTRIIVPNADIAACYACHRLETPMPPRMPQVSVPVPLPEAAEDHGNLEMVRLTRNPNTDINAVWCPDGRKIAWVSNRSGRFQIWTMRSDGTRKRPLTRGPAIHGWPMWSPDGDRLVFWGYNPQSGRSSITVVKADGSDRVELVASPEALDRPVWRPDGRYIAYAAQQEGNWDIWVISIDSRRLYRLTHDAQMETNPLWSPDGMTIGYKVAPNKAYNLTIENFISVANGLDAPTYRVWDGIKSIQMNAWSPDGRRIAYTAEAVTNASGKDRVSYLAVVEDIHLRGSRTSGTPIVLSQGLTLGDRGPVFSPSGDRVAFWAWDRSYQASLWMAPVDGSEAVQLTTGGADMYPQFSPDGQSLLFESGRGGNMDIWVMALE